MLASVRPPISISISRFTSTNWARRPRPTSMSSARIFPAWERRSSKSTTAPVMSLATVQFGDGGEFSHYLRSPSGSWKQITHFKDKIVQIVFGPNDRLYLVSRAGAPRGRIESISLTDPDISHAKVVVPEGPDAIVADFQHGGAKLVPTADRLYVEYQLGGPSELRVFDSRRPTTDPTQATARLFGVRRRQTGGERCSLRQHVVRRTAGVFPFPCELRTARTKRPWRRSRPSISATSK